MIRAFWHAAHQRHAAHAGNAAAPGAVIALGAMALAGFMIATDITTLGVILPRIEAVFDAQVSTVQWVVNAYALVFGMLLITGGRLADLLGRRRMFLAGVALFGVASAIAGAAPGVFWLIGARVLMGAGAALMWPPMLSISYAVLPREKAAFAGMVILAAMGLGAASGPLIGGTLAEFVSWRWVLLVNVPIAAVLLLVVRSCAGIPVQSRRRERIDYGGIVTLSAALLALLLALDQASDWGFSDARIIGMLAAAAVFFTAFLLLERRAGESALVPGSLLRVRVLGSALAARILIAGAWFVVLVYLPVFMQKVLQFSPLQAGLGLLPLMLGFLAASFVAGPLYPRLGPRVLGVSGIFAIVAGCALLLFITSGSVYAALLPGMLLAGCGYGLCANAFNTAGVMAVPEEHASLAGAMLYMCQLVGGALGLGGATTLLATTSAAYVQGTAAGGALSAQQVQALGGVLAGTESSRTLLSHFPAQAAQMQEIARAAFTTGMHNALVLVIALGFVSVVIAALFMKGRPRAADGKEASGPQRRQVAVSEN